MAVNCDRNITHLAVGDHDFAKVWVFPVFADDSNSNITPVNGSFFSLSGSDGHPQSPFYLNSSSTLCTFDLAINQFYENPLGALTDFTDDTGTYEVVTLLFQSNATTSSTVAYCPVTTTYVHSTVFCASGSCAITASEPSSLKHPNSNLTNLGFVDAFKNFSYALEADQANLFNDPEVETIFPSPLELYIADPDSTPLGGTESLTIFDVSIDDFSSRLQQLINAYWYGGYNPAAFMGGGPLPDEMASVTQGQHVVSREVCTCNLAWLGVLFLATALMFVAAVAGLCFSLATRGPDILGYFSTNLRDSKFVYSAFEDSTLNGRGRAKKLGKVRVKLADVDEEKEVGYVAIAECPRKSLAEQSGKRHYR